MLGAYDTQLVVVTHAVHVRSVSVHWPWRVECGATAFVA